MKQFTYEVSNIEKISICLSEVQKEISEERMQLFTRQKRLEKIKLV